MNALQRDLKKLVPLVESLGAERVESDPPPPALPCAAHRGLAQ